MTLQTEDSQYRVLLPWEVIAKAPLAAGYGIQLLALQHVGPASCEGHPNVWEH